MPPTRTPSRPARAPRPATPSTPPRLANPPYAIAHWLPLVSVLASALALAVAVTLWTQTPRVGYVDTARLLAEYDGAAEARATLDAEKASLQANVQTLQRELDSLAVAEGGAGVTASDRVQEKTGELERYALAAQTAAQQRELELTKPLFDVVNAGVKRFAEAEGYDLVLGTVAGGNILYGHPSADLTDEVVGYLNRSR